MGSKRSGTTANRKRKRGTAQPRTPPQTKKSTRYRNPYVEDENDQFLPDAELRASPDPVEGSSTTPVPPAQATAGMERQPSPLQEEPLPRADRPRTTAPSRDNQPADPNARARPVKARNETIRARLQDVVQILMRKAVIDRLTAPFQTTLPEGERLGLCKNCRRLDLAPQHFLVGSSAMPSNRRFTDGSRRHGTFVSIYAKAYVCRLCRLIMRALAEQPYAKLVDIVQQGRRRTGTLLHMNAVCDLRWEIDGRLPHLEDSPRTRRLCIEWDDPCYEKAYLFMVKPNRTSTEDRAIPPDFLGRRLRPSADLDNYDDKVETIQKWLGVCMHYHSECRPGHDSDFERDLRQTGFFGVIDVETMRFTPLPHGAQYVALSYQWGPKDDTRYTTTVTTVLNIMTGNGLTPHLASLPLTIQEAINLVRALEFKYLWVDSICIVQDSPKAWERNARVMDLLYGNAALTICAADGEDANAGLWALSRPDRRASQAIESYNDGLQLMARYPCEVYVRQSRWFTRAWTYQERLLSKRCLIFTQGRMYFQCRETTLCEDVDMETPARGTSLDTDHSPGQHYRNFATISARTYMEHVSSYTIRDLSNPEDILSAFRGVGKTVCKHLGADSIFGLPNSHFDLALLWDPADAPQRRTPENKVSFPSWSWCGWDKRKMLYREYMVSDCMLSLREWLLLHTWITYYIRDGNGDLRLVWDAQRHGQRNVNLSSHMCGYRRPPEPTFSNRHDLYGREIADSMVDLDRNEFKCTIPDFPVQVRTLQPGEDSALTLGRRDQGILQFWTWSAYLKLQIGDSPSSGQIFSRRYDIVDRNGSWAGTIVLPKRWHISTDHPQHFIAISEARKFWPEEHEPRNDYSVKARNDYSATDREWPLYNVLLLGADQKDAQNGVCDDSPAPTIWYRIGLGKVYQDALHQAFDQTGAFFGPSASNRKVWREIVLG